MSVFRFIAAKKAEFPVSLLCSTLGVSTAGLYAWWTRPPSQRALDDAQRTAHSARIHDAPSAVTGRRACMPSCALRACGSAESALSG